MKPWQTAVRYGAIALASVMIFSIAFWGLRVVGFTLGLASIGTYEEAKVYSFNANGIENLKIDIAAAQFSLSPSNGDKITVKTNIKNLTAKESGNTIKIKEKQGIFTVTNTDAFVEIFYPSGFEFDEVDVREYYFGEDSASYMQIFLYSHAYDATRVEEIRNSVASQGTKKAVAEYMTGFSTAGYEEIFDGSVVGRYELDRAYYSELSDAIFSLGTGETSAPIKVGSGDDEGYYIIYKLAATEDYFDNHYELVEKSYIINALGKNLQSYEAALASSAVFTEAYNEIIHADIEMD